MKLNLGTHITCEGGHHIATVRNGLVEDTPPDAGDFEWRIEPAPQNGDVMAPCPHCGAAYIREGFQIHTPAGWWPA